MDAVFPTVTPLAGQAWCLVHGYYDVSKFPRCPACEQFNPLAVMVSGGG